MARKHIPPPLTSGPLCEDCKGTGANLELTLALPEWDTGHVRCRTCHGNGLDPAPLFYEALNCTHRKEN